MCETYKIFESTDKYVDQGDTKKITTAQEIVEFAAAMAEFSNYIENQACKKLMGVMMPSSPAAPEKNEAAREFPPLFNELRMHLATIQINLSHIGNMLDRAEL